MDDFIEQEDFIFVVQQHWATMSDEQRQLYGEKQIVQLEEQDIVLDADDQTGQEIAISKRKIMSGWQHFVKEKS